MTRTLSDLHSEVVEADGLLTEAISGGIEAFVASLRDRAVVDWRIYRIAEWRCRIPLAELQNVPSVDWASLANLRVRLAHRFHTIDPVLMFVFSAMHVPKLRNALAKSLTQ
jgi:uncharacterized protein with HEPN domain